MEKQRMPALFVGHGSPLNAIEDNLYSRAWRQAGKALPRPEAILSVSAHWYTAGTRVNDSTRPNMIYDMYGFPDELYRVVYPAPGSPELAHSARSLISRDVQVDNTWGLDHGTWSVLHRMYPGADIPVFQLSIDSHAPASVHYSIGQEIGALRDQGVMILGSGNVVHNLSLISWSMQDGFPWAQEFDAFINDKIINRDFPPVIDYSSAGDSARLAFFTPEHYFPLLYVLGAARKDDQLRVFNDSITMGSVSMTSYVFE